MSIWKTPLNAESMIKRYSQRATIHDVLGIQFTEFGDDYLKATMPVDSRTHQPIGILHGGASCVLAESLGSVGANFCLNPHTHYAVGLDIHTTHIRSVTSGIVTGTARPVHLGRSVQVWEIKIVNEEDKLVSVTRLNVFVKEHEHPKA
jgi:1,4-dihydroxy-2-naphthoyl-CoA hydrolase